MTISKEKQQNTTLRLVSFRDLYRVFAGQLHIF